MEQLGKIRGFAPPPRWAYDQETHGAGALFAGGPEEIAERIVNLHGKLGHMRQFFQMDVGQMPQKDFLRSIELLGTKVKPLVDAELSRSTPQPESKNAV